MFIFLQGLILVVVALYLIALITAVFLSNRIIFQPRQAGYADHPGILKLTSSDGAKISSMYLPNPEAIFTVLFSHGNAEDIGDDQPLLEHIRRPGSLCSPTIIRGTGRAQEIPRNGMPTRMNTQPTTFWCNRGMFSRAESLHSDVRSVAVRLASWHRVAQSRD